MNGEEYAEHDTEETQYRRRMRIESGIQVVRHVPTIRRDLLSAALIGHTKLPMPRARNQIQHPCRFGAARACARRALGISPSVWRSESALDAGALQDGEVQIILHTLRYPTNSPPGTGSTDRPFNSKRGRPTI